MFTRDEIAFARSRAEETTGIRLSWDVEVLPGDGLELSWGEGQARIAASDINGLTRGFFQLCRAVREGKSEGEISQTRHFASCGAMLDMSRNAVMKPERVKKYMDQLACLGMNLLMLYTEDTYEVPEYPAFGYLRGGYTQEELRDLDDYAISLGIELVPCIQTLAHLGQFLQWSPAASLMDQPDVLLADDPATYEFIEAEIRAVSGCFRSRRIHVGMDEAHGIGLGRYYAQHGPTDRFELLNRHLNRVVKICEKYGMKPMMWSDMFFRLGSKTNQYYDKEADIPQRVIDALPPVGMVYWDYYHMDEDMYSHMLKEHQRMGKETVFAGGIWTWSGFLPQVKRTEQTMKPGLKACAKYHVDTVFATLWGDDGQETNHMLASSLLPMFSEACWQGPDYEEAEAVLSGECLTGLPREALDAMGEFYPSGEDQRPGKQMIWGAPLYPLTMLGEGDSYEAIIARSQRARDTLDKYPDRLECRYASLLFAICAQKAEWLSQLRSRYKAGDRAWLRDAAEIKAPALLSAYAQLEETHRELWERDNRRFGWEVLCQRYGASKERLLDAQRLLRQYLAGEIPAIQELEAEPRGIYKSWHWGSYSLFSVPPRMH